MTNWYAYRWVCNNCRAIHYYAAGNCQQCNYSKLTKEVHNQKLVDGLKAVKQRQKAAEDKRKTRYNPPNLKEPAHPPAVEDDDLLGKSGGETVQHQGDDPGNDPLDDLINDILDS